MLGLLASAFPAWAAEIVEVRVGRHPDFTRVVFELDRAAGYRIERSDPSKEKAGLVISLEASSRARTVDSRQTLVEQVAIESMGSRSVARVRLAKDGLRLKEMILTNPPRIVLDLMNDAAPAAKLAKATKTPSTPSPSKSTSKPSTSTVTTATTTAKVVDTRTPVAPPRRVEPAPSAATAALEKAQSETSEATRALEQGAEELFANQPSTSTPIEKPEAGTDLAAPMQPVQPVQKVARPEPAPKPIAKAQPGSTPGQNEAKPAPRPMVARTKPSGDAGGGWMTWALVGVGALALVAGGVFLARRRSGTVWTADDDDSDSFEDDDTAVVSAGENPFGGLSSGGSDRDAERSMLGRAGDVTAQPLTNDGEATLVSLPDDEKESESVVFDSEETVMDDMEVISRDQVNESLGGSMPPVMGGAIPEEFQQMMTEMSRRLSALESRCDELVDARDRLERQVAAQTEELRVQRAAIARTQRAVRNLGRPEGEEQEATEPALRDPNQPTS